MSISTDVIFNEATDRRLRDNMEDGPAYVMQDKEGNLYVPGKPTDDVTWTSRGRIMHDDQGTFYRTVVTASALQSDENEDEDERFVENLRQKRGLQRKTRTTPTVTKDDGTIERTISSDRLDFPKPIDKAAFHGIMGDIINRIAPHTEADPAGLLAEGLVIFGNIIGSSCRFHQGTWQRTNLFVITAGETSKARKGTAHSNIAEVFDIVHPDWDRLLVPGLGSGEGLLTRLAGDEKTKADGTVVGSPPEPRAILFESEFGSLLTRMTRDGSTISATIRDAWDGSALGRTIARDSTIVTDHHVSLIGHITQVELAQKLTSTENANGFGNRFLWVAVQRPRVIPFTEPVGDYVQSQTWTLKQSIEWASQPHTFKWTPAARQEWERHYRLSQDKPLPGLLGLITARADPQIARLAMIYAALDRTEEIDVVHLRAAIAFMNYVIRSCRYIFGDSTGNSDADALLAILRTRDAHEIGLEECRKELGLASTARRNAVVDLLVQLKLVRLVEVREPGRRKITVIRLIEDELDEDES